ncbi:MAG TPA: SprT family zinc-dependent metalloprotease [Gammaproteobacteria bacterium]|nr:SprT family zinc-dependent metalloprotease [Gammaproteobacteria bacterium]
MVEQLELLIPEESQYDSSFSRRLVVRESLRARRMFLHVTPPLGVELVVPRGTRSRTVAAFVESHREWIDAAHAQIAREYVGDRSMQPTSVNLPSIGKTLSLSYRYDPQSRRQWKSDAGSLLVVCARRECDDAGDVLRQWLLHEARRVLPGMVTDTAGEIGVQPKRVQVRLQKTRWGSCSATGTISINAAILFLEPELVRYLIVHELCHMRHMNHSRAFWRCVGEFVADYRRLDQRLSGSWQQIPWWAMRWRAR